MEKEKLTSMNDINNSQDLNVKKRHPILQVLHDIDTKMSSNLAICASKTSQFAALRPYLIGLEISCHGIPWLSGCLIAIWLFSSVERQGFFVNLLFALILDLVFVAILKATFRRKRPPTNEDDMFCTVSIDKMSCPSGHTSRAVMLSCIFAAKCYSWSVFHLISYIWCICTCASRVMLGRHYMGDVTIGAVLGYFQYLLMTVIWLSTDTTSWLLNTFSDSAAEDLL